MKMGGDEQPHHGGHHHHHHHQHDWHDHSFAEGYHKNEAVRKNAKSVSDHLLAHLPEFSDAFKERNAAIAYIGAGPGQALFLLSEHASALISIDYSSAMNTLFDQNASAVTKDSWPTHTVPQLSPKTPSTKTLTSNETTSPSRRTRESGIPWQMTSFGDAQIDLGKPM